MLGMANLLLLHGPNLNLLGQREPEHYGYATLADIDQHLHTIAIGLGHHLVTFQSNAEFALIDRIHQSLENGIEMIIINPAAFTHTSIALRDALLGVAIPFIEIHLSNVHAREPFRKQSYFSDKAIGIVCGFGAYGYELALQAAHHYLSAHKES